MAIICIIEWSIIDLTHAAPTMCNMTPKVLIFIIYCTTVTLVLHWKHLNVSVYSAAAF